MGAHLSKPAFHSRGAVRFFGVIVTAVLLSLGGAGVGSAQVTTTFAVTNGNDSGPGSFRQAIADANQPTVSGPVEIVFDSGLHVALVTGEVVYTNNFDIHLVGNGSTLDGQNNVGPSPAADDRIFRVNTGGNPVSLTVDSLTFANGSSTVGTGTNGAAIVITDGPLTVRNSTFVGNVSSTTGGAIFAGFVPVTVENSTFVGNVSNGGYGGGAISAGGPVTVSNSTFTGNSAAAAGGAIGTFDSVDLTHVTMSGNSATNGSDVFAVGSLTTFGAVLASPGGPSPSCVVGSTTSSHSYDTDGSCGFIGIGDTSAGPDPLLGVLGSNGGPTQTMVPAATSPLVDAIPTMNCVVSTDQRGIARPQLGGCDIGSVEVEPAGPSVSTPPSKDACRVWVPYTDDEGRPFKNRGDCVSFVASGGKNKAKG